MNDDLSWNDVIIISGIAFVCGAIFYMMAVMR